MTNRQKMIERIRALLSKTVERGATEAEMASALAKAREMMDAHDLSEGDLREEEERVTREMRVRTDHDDVRSHLTPSVGRFCRCSSWKERGVYDSVVFCGLESEVVFAHWLLDMLADFVVRERDTYRRRRDATRLQVKSFVRGCADRIGERLDELSRVTSSTGTDLVLSRQSLIDTYLSEHGIKLRESVKMYKVDPEAARAGRGAGDRARFSRPVNDGTTKGLLR